MPSIQFQLNISAQDYQAYYSGRTNKVMVRVGGRKYIFPADRLRPFVSNAGVHGRFQLTYDAQNKFMSLIELK